MPANGGLFRFSRRSPASRFREGRGEIARSLRPHIEIFPFSGDGGRRLGSVLTAWRDAQCAGWKRPFDILFNLQKPAIRMPQEDEAHHRQEVLVAREIGVCPQCVGPCPQAFFDLANALQLPAPIREKDFPHVASIIRCPPQLRFLTPRAATCLQSEWG